MEVGQASTVSNILTFQNESSKFIHIAKASAMPNPLHTLGQPINYNGVVHY